MTLCVCLLFSLFCNATFGKLAELINCGSEVRLSRSLVAFFWLALRKFAVCSRSEVVFARRCWDQIICIT